ncbi:MAG: hypothetical protein EKK55_15710 [Rhodocyclaceae bacterium]|nr:MAG: hypothetical protein EKK55_15710 [Rhodocyclaceae bacterium]
MAYINGHSLRDTVPTQAEAEQFAALTQARKEIQAQQDDGFTAKGIAVLATAGTVGYFTGQAVKKKTKSKVKGIAAGVAAGLFTDIVASYAVKKL